MKHWKIAGKSIEEGVPLEDSITEQMKKAGQSKSVEESVKHWKIAGKFIEEGVPLEDSNTHLTFKKLWSFLSVYLLS